MFSGVYFDTNESMRLLTAGSLVRVQLGEPNERNRFLRFLFSFCLSRAKKKNNADPALQTHRLLTAEDATARCAGAKEQPKGQRSTSK